MFITENLEKAGGNRLQSLIYLYCERYQIFSSTRLQLKIVFYKNCLR